MVLSEVREDGVELELLVDFWIHFFRRDSAEMNDANLRHDYADRARCFDAAGEINVVEQEGVVFVEQGAEVRDQIAPDEAEGRPRLVDLLHSVKADVTVEVVALQPPTEEEAIDGPAESMIVRDEEQGSGQSSVELLAITVGVDQKRSHNAGVGMVYGISDEGRDSVVGEQDVVVGDDQVTPPADLVALVTGFGKEKIVVIEKGDHAVVLRGDLLDGVSTFIRRTVVDENEFEVDTEGVLENRTKTLLEHHGTVPVGNDNRDRAWSVGCWVGIVSGSHLFEARRISLLNQGIDAVSQ